MSRVRVPDGVPPRWNHLGSIVGVFNGEGPPVPIPNTEVKLTSAENTCLATDWEDRSMPTQRKDSPSAVFSLSLLSAEVSLRFFVTHFPGTEGIGSGFFLVLRP